MYHPRIWGLLKEGCSTYVGILPEASSTYVGTMEKRWPREFIRIPAASLTYIIYHPRICVYIHINIYIYIYIYNTYAIWPREFLRIHAASLKYYSPSHATYDYTYSTIHPTKLLSYT